MENIFDILDRIDINKIYKIYAKDYVAQITPIDYSDHGRNTNTEIFAPSSYVNFSECEKKLRDFHKILSPRKITFIQIELNNTNDDILVNQLEYQAYDDNHTILNLSLCENKNITIHYSIKPEKENEINLLLDFKDKGIDILDINDNFFNDVCLPYDDTKKELTLKNRIEEIYKNYTFCEKNCIKDKVIFEEMTVICNCTIKNNIDVEKFNFDVNKYKVVTENQNFKIAKCFNAFSSLKDNLKNLGFWIFLILMIINIILLILFRFSLKPIQEEISNEMTKNGYIKPADEGHLFCHNYIKKLDRLIIKLNKMKNDFIEKKQGSPPKRKTHIININDKSDRKNILHKTFNKSKKNKDISNDIESLKIRMEKTKRPKTKINSHKSTKGECLDETNKIENFSNKNIINFRTNENNNTNNNSSKINLINTNLNDLKNQVYIPQESKHILNIYSFKEFLNYDKRSFSRIFFIFLISKQSIMHAIFYKSPIEPLPVRLALLKFIFSCDLALNAIFYTDSKISENYNSVKNIIILSFTNNIIIIILSVLISYILLTFFIHLINSTNKIMNLFRSEEEKIKNNKKYFITIQRRKEIITEVKNIIKKFKIKVIIFFIVEFLFIIFFWYYTTIFCFVYNKTQLSWLLDCFITIIMKIVVELFVNLIFSLLYKCSISFKSKCLYSVIIFLYCFL